MRPNTDRSNPVNPAHPTHPAHLADPGQETMSSRSDDWSADLSDRDRPDAVDDDRRDRVGKAGTAITGSTGSWQDIKCRFVDDPAGAVAAAEQLVQQAVEHRIHVLQQEAADLCAQEGSTSRDDRDARGADASTTELLRNRLIRYQEYCERLAGSSIH